MKDHRLHCGYIGCTKIELVDDPNLPEVLIRWATHVREIHDDDDQALRLERFAIAEGQRRLRDGQ